MRPADISLGPSVLSLGKVVADGATNIIPEEVKVEGTFRAMDEEWRMKAHQIERNCRGNRQIHGES